MRSLLSWECHRCWRFCDANVPSASHYRPSVPRSFAPLSSLLLSSARAIFSRTDRGREGGGLEEAFSSLQADHSSWIDNTFVYRLVQKKIPLFEFPALASAWQTDQTHAQPIYQLRKIQAEFTQLSCVFSLNPVHHIFFFQDWNTLVVIRLVIKI